MAKYQTFEELPVWQEAAKLYEQADDFLENAPPRMRASFRDQFERVVLSVSNNIAEGFERARQGRLCVQPADAASGQEICD